MAAAHLPTSDSVSVALATYQGERHLRAQLDSLAAQTRPPDELVVSDDGSTDATLRIVEGFARTAPFPVRVLPSEGNTGYTRNFARALDACRGDLVFVCDQDDVWHPDKIEAMVDAMRRAPGALLAIHDLRYCDAELRPTGQTKLQRVRWTLDPRRRYVTGMATVVRRELLACCLPVPDPDVITYDRWLHACAVALDGKAIVERVLADYRRHDASVTAAASLNAASSSRARRLSDPLRRSTRGVEVRVRLLEALPAWLARAEGCLVEAGLASADAVARARAASERDARLARDRLEQLALPRRRRLLPIARLWLRGGYRPFSGVKSLLVDVLRR